MKLKSTLKHVVKVRDWDNFIKKVYGKPYSFQQQDGCKLVGTYEFTIPFEKDYDYSQEGYQTVREALERKGPWMPTRFDVWLTISNEEFGLFDVRRIYPHVCEVIIDLQKKNLLEDGNYIINID